MTDEIDVLKLSNIQKVDQLTFTTLRAKITDLRALLDKSVENNDRLIKIEEKNKQKIVALNKLIDRIKNEDRATSVSLSILLTCTNCGVEMHSDFELNKDMNVGPAIKCPKCGRHVASFLLTGMKKNNLDRREDEEEPNNE